MTTMQFTNGSKLDEFLRGVTPSPLIFSEVCTLTNAPPPPHKNTMVPRLVGWLRSKKGNKSRKQKGNVKNIKKIITNKLNAVTNGSKLMSF